MEEVGAGMRDIYFPPEPLTVMAGLITTGRGKRTQIGTCWEIPVKAEFAGKRVGYILGRTPESGQRDIHIGLGEKLTSGVHAILVISYNPNGRPADIALVPALTTNGTVISQPGSADFASVTPGRQVRLTPDTLDSVTGITTGESTRFRLGGYREYDVVLTPGAKDSATKQPISLAVRVRNEV